MSVTKRAGCVFCWQRRAFFSLHSSPSLQRRSPLHPINLNTATPAELQQVPGIGPSTADKILKMRKSYDPFKNVDDLRVGLRFMEISSGHQASAQNASKKCASI